MKDTNLEEACWEAWRKMSFPEAVNIIRNHLTGARGEVSEDKLIRALLVVFPSLEDIAEAQKSENRSAGQQRKGARSARRL